MRAVDLIEKKKKGEKLSRADIKWWIDSVMDGTMEDYQTSALLMAIYFNGMDIDETTYLTDYMVKSGEILDLSEIGQPVADKHSTGGVGDKITLMFLPILAAAGIPIAKLSGRGLGYTGGTIDKAESIPGFRTNLSTEEFKTNIKKIGAALASQTKSLAPADGKLYALRDVTATVDIIPLIASSVVSKKIASGADIIVLDVKYGSGAFMKTAADAIKLAECMVETGKRLDRKICAVITSMEEPLGRAIGNSLEVIEAIEFLKGNSSKDLEEITYTLAGLTFERMGKFRTVEEGKAYLLELIKSGKALDKFREIIAAQGGDVKVVDDYSLFPTAKLKYEVKAECEGFVFSTDALLCAKASKILGAGREKKSDGIDYSAGVYLNKKPGEKVKPGDTIATLYYNEPYNPEEAAKCIKQAFEFSVSKPDDKVGIYKIIK